MPDSIMSAFHQKQPSESPSDLHRRLKRLELLRVGEASSGSSAIEEAVSEIVHSVRSASTSARELDSCANQLRHAASALSGEVAAFLDEVRAA